MEVSIVIGSLCKCPIGFNGTTKAMRNVFSSFIEFTVLLKLKPRIHVTLVVLIDIPLWPQTYATENIKTESIYFVILY